MPTIQELRQKAQELKMQEDFKNALTLFREIWEREKSERNGYDLAQCLRKTSNYEEARTLHQTIKTNFPNFHSQRIQNEELWLDYSEKIKNYQNPNLLADAEQLLLKTNKYDKYTGSIYNKTVLNVVKSLIYEGNNSIAIEWLEKLDFTTLDNIPFKNYPSDRKTFFIHYADVLIKLDKHIEHIEKYLTCLNFDGIKHTEFKNKIIEDITYGDYVSRSVLALYLKYFKEEFYRRKNNVYTSIYNPNKITLISDLSDFEFCPASFAISETFTVASNAAWEINEWNGEKKYLIDRYNEFQKSKSINEVFNDNFLIAISDTTEKDFTPIFNSKLIFNNYNGLNEAYFSNSTDTIRGKPDYIFENANSERFVVVEKFTKRTSEKIQTAFSNDLVKVYGYIFELETLNVDFGYLIYWYWEYEDIPMENGSVKKKIKIKAYRIFKIEKNINNKSKLENVIEKVKSFKQSKEFSVDGDKISFANKCLHCSVVSLCNHKTGKFNLIKLPYDVNSLTVIQEPTLLKNE
ncbi:MAG: tetratricopeptide repeat protein [Bacteroidetes bacterium]|nr:tetratricopeptide repeat protein [Bacteroidota bacterium]